METDYLITIILSSVLLISNFHCFELVMLDVGIAPC